MVTGPFINASAVLVGGVLGALLSQRLPERIRTAMTSIFGLASLGIGILLVIWKKASIRWSVNSSS